MTFTVTGTTKTSAVLAEEAAAARLVRCSVVIDAHVEARARALGYNSAASCAGYVNSTVTSWADEALRFILWRDSVWQAVFGALAEGDVPDDPLDEALLIAVLPPWEG